MTKKKTTELTPKEQLKNILLKHISNGMTRVKMSRVTGVSYDRIVNFLEGRREVVDVNMAQELLRGLGEEMTLK